MPTGACSRPALFHDQSRLRRAPRTRPRFAAEPLTEREREVLRHVAGLLSTAEVASEMHISVNTVRTHLKTSTASWRRLAAARRSAGPASWS